MSIPALLRTFTIAAAGLCAGSAVADVYVDTAGPNNLDLIPNGSFINTGITSGFVPVTGVFATNVTGKAFDSLYSYSDSVVDLNNATFSGYDMLVFNSSIINYHGGTNDDLTVVTFDDATFNLSGGSIAYLGTGGGTGFGGSATVSGGTITQNITCLTGAIAVTGGNFSAPTYGMPYSFFSFTPAGISFAGSGIVAHYIGIETGGSFDGNVWLLSGTLANGGSVAGLYMVDVGIFDPTVIVNYAGVAIAGPVVINNPPVVDAGADLSASEGDSVALLGTASDPDNDPLTYAWTQTAGPAVVLANASTLAPSFTTPSVPFSGAVLVFQLAVSDGQGSPVTDTVTVNVGNVNAPPVASAGSDATVAEDSSVTLSGAGSFDPDGGTLTMHWSQVPGFGPAVVLADADTSSPSFTAPSVTAGQGSIDLKFQLVVNDGNLDSGPSTVTVHVLNSNDAPTANAGSDQSVNELDPVTLSGALSSDPDGNALTYSWTQILGAPTVALSGASSATPSFQAPELSVGGQTDGTTLTFELTVTDTAGATGTSTVNVRVSNVNHAPLADAGTDLSVPEGANVTLNGASSADTDGDALSYAWSQVSGPTVTLSSASTATPSFTAPDIGAGGATLAFALVVGDGYGGSSTDEVIVNVSFVDQPPTADAGATQSVNEGDTALLAGTASDPDGNAVTVAWTQLSGPAVTLANANTLSPSFLAPLVTLAGADVELRLTVDDGFGGSNSSDVTVHIGNVNQAPTAQAPANMTVPEATPVSLIGQGQDTDTEEQAQLTYAWQQTGGPAVTLSGAGANVSFSSPNVTSGGDPAATVTLTFTLTVTDPNGAMGTSSVNVVVSNIPHAPTAVAGGNLTVNESSSVTLNGSASSDPDGDALTYAWTQVSGPAVTLSGAGTALPSFSAPLVTSAGATLKFKLTVSDPFGATSSATVTVSVRNVSDPPNVCNAYASICKVCDGRRHDDDDDDHCSGNGNGSGNGHGNGNGNGNCNNNGNGNGRGRDQDERCEHQRGNDLCANTMWPPDHSMVCVSILGISDPSRTMRITITGVKQDEATNGLGDGDTPIDAIIRPDGTVLLRAERKGNGNGRVYHVRFTATTAGGSSSGMVKVFVPKSKKTDTAVDGGELFDSTR